MNRCISAAAALASLTLSGILSGCGHSADPIAGPSRYGQEGIRVTATAIARSAPDLAIVTLGCEASSARAGAAKERGDAAIARVIEALRKQGVPANAIQTTEYELSRSWEPGARPWTLSTTVEVRVTDVAKVAQVVDAATDAGANRIGSVQFRMQSLGALRSKARADAVRVAREKAEQLAKETGVHLGEVVAITDAPQENPWPWYGYGGGTANSVRNTATPGRSAGSADAESQFASGQASADARIEVVFAIRKG